MEPNAINAWELKSLSVFLTMTPSPSNSPFPVSPESISRLSTDYPLFSFTISLCILIILYFPRAMGFCLSPVIVITALSLLCLLRLGTVQRTEKSRGIEEVVVETRSEIVEKSDSLTRTEKRVGGGGSEPDDPGFEVSFVQWDVGAPLEVIYEEGGEDDDNSGGGSKGGYAIEGNQAGLERYPSLLMYYPETDSDCSSDGGGDYTATGGWDLAAEGGRFKWEEEDREELLIEIALDRSTKGKGKELEWDLDLDLDFNSDLSFHGEEENLIEIDISPGKLDDVFSREV